VADFEALIAEIGCKDPTTCATFLKLDLAPAADAADFVA